MRQLATSRLIRIVPLQHSVPPRNSICSPCMQPSYRGPWLFPWAISVKLLPPFIRKSWESGIFPREWKKEMPLRSRREVPAVITKIRGICVYPAVAKTIAKVILNRINNNLTDGNATSLVQLWTWKVIFLCVRPNASHSRHDRRSNVDFSSINDNWVIEGVSEFVVAAK